MILNARSLALLVETYLYLGSTLNFITPSSYKGGHAVRVESTSPYHVKSGAWCARTSHLSIGAYFVRKYVQFSRTSST